MDIESYFSSSYSEARNKFLGACGSQSLVVDKRENPNARGAQDERLFTDIARIGPANASKSLLLLSATHGVEGYCGSGVQTGLIAEGLFDMLPGDVQVLFVHAMNPYGFSHNRRVNEDNVDLNRNFLDFEEARRPKNQYSKIHQFLVPEDWEGPAREHADLQLKKFAAEHGMASFQAAVSSGQYVHSDGLFYGGTGPTWSNRMFRSVLKDYLADTDVIGTIDFHTGLGTHGYGELITVGSDEEKSLAENWYGSQVTDPEVGTSASAPLDGMVAHGISDTLPQARKNFITLEFGTEDVFRVLTALRGDNWLYQQKTAPTELFDNIKRNTRTAFYPDTRDWKRRVWERSLEVVAMAVAGLSQIEGSADCN